MAFLTGGYQSQNSSQQSQFQNQQAQQQQGQSATNRTLTPFQSNLQAPVFAQIVQQLQDPYAAVAPLRNQARNQVDQNYSGLADTVRSQFLSSGGGTNGKYGKALVAGDLARRSQLSNVDNQAQVMAAQNQMTWAQIAQGLLAMNFGSSTTGSSSGSAAANGTASASGESSGFNIGGGIGTR